MAVSTIALYAGPSSSVCSGQHPISSHASHDFDVNARSTSSSAASPSQKALIGGLSCLFSSSPIKSANYASGAEELGSTWHDRVVDELGSAFRYSSLSSSLKRDQAHQSPVSVLQGINSSIGSSSRSPPMRISGDFCSTRSVTGGITIDFGSIRSGPGEICNGFGRNVLGSSVASSPLDLDVKDFDLPCALSPCEHELTFNMEDSFVGTDLPPYARDLLSEAQSRHPIFRDDFIIKAFCEAERAHRGQMRSSGHPYLQHCVETAVLLANIGANSTVVAAGLLHDTVDDSFVTYDTISRSFGAEIADLVEGVSKLSQLSKLARENNTANKTVEADRLHTMFLAMADARAVLIKLADRLHNMSTLDALASFKQQRFAKETLEIFAPLANRLGVSTWKERLENLCFKYLNPDRHGELSSKLENFFDESAIRSCLSKLERALKDGGIAYHGLLGRHKSLYSIFSKMLKKKLNMDEIHDIHGLRLIVETKEDCYKALDIVRQLWHEVPGRFKDYIVSPKFNGYQSIHTVVTGERMIPFEVQIRTKEMHRQAEYGIAAHWRYKEGDCIHPTFVLQMVEWARWVISWQCEATSKDPPALCFADSVKLPCTFPTHSKDCTFSCKLDCGPVFVVVIENDKMSVQEMPANSSVKDLLEKTGRGGSRGGFFSGPQLNHKPISDPARKLKMGDVVELTLALPDKSLIEYREEIQRMYDRGVKGASPSTVGSSASARSRHVFS